MWQAAFYVEEERALGRALTAVDRVRVRRKHPIPTNIDFRGAT
jgi:hypothetical protein